VADDISLTQGQEDGDATQGFGLDTKQSERNKLQPFMETIAQPDVGKRMQEGADAVDRGLQQFNVEAQSQYDMAVRAARERVAAAQTASEGDTAQSIADRKLLADQLAMPFSVVTKAQEEAKRELVIRNLSQNQYMSMWASQNEVNATYARDYLDTVVDFFKDAPNWGNELMHWLAFDSGKAVERFGYNLTEGAAQANKAFVDFGRMFAENIGMEPAAKYLEGASKSLDRYRNLAEQFGVGRPKEDKVGALWDEFVKSVPQQAWNLMSLALFKRPMPGTLAVGAGEVAGARAAAAVNPLLAKAGEGLAGMGVMGAQIAGGSYGELREQGVSPEIAGIAAAGNALMQAPMEKFGLESFVDIFRARGMREAMLKAVTSIFSEGATEWAQKWPEYLAHTWALSEKHGNNVFDRANWFVSNLFDWKNIQQANDEAMLEAAVGAMWGGLGGGVRIAMTRNMQQKAREQADFLLGVRQITQMAIDKGMPPEVVQTMLEAKQPLMASTGYVDAEAALTLYQEGNAAVLDALGVTEEELTQLADEGGAVPIQLSDLETRVDQATFDQLYQHVSIRPGAHTAAEGAQPMDANAYSRSALAEARRKANQIPGVSQELSRMYHELLDSGISRQQARDNSTLLAVQAATLQAKGFDALSWLKRRKYVVGEDGQTYTVPVGLPQTENAELVSEDVRNQISSSTDRDALSQMYFANQQAIEAAGENQQERDRLQAVNRMVEARLAMLNELEQRGYHGSGRRGIRQFDLRHAGEGEGGAAHGHGVYVAQAKGIANGYRIMAAGPDYTYNGRSLTELRESLNRQNDYDKLEIVDDFMLKQNAEEMDWDDYDEDAAEWFRGEVLPNLEGKGQVYEVEVPENDVLLDEQATLENQPEAVKQAVQAAVDELGIDPSGVGRDIYSAISGALGSDRQASEWLSEHGVKGITYVGERDGRAFVVFTGEDVSIVGTMFQGDGPTPDADAVAGPELYQVQNLPEWKERLRAWGKANEVPAKKIEKFIKGIEGQMKIIDALKTKDGIAISDLIAQQVRGAGQAKPGRSKAGFRASGPVRTNIDEIYQISFDASSMCVKRLSAAKTAAAVQSRIGRPLTADENMALIALYRAEGKEAPCIYCYVESNRRRATEAVGAARDMIAGTKDIPDGWKPDRKKKVEDAREEFKKAGLTREDINADFVLDPATADTEQAIETKKKFPSIYGFLNFEAANTKQNKVKLYEEYVGNLLDLKKEQVELLNGYAGLRFFSTSDFQIEHVVDLMQAFADMAAIGAKSHAYTKVPLYVDIFGDTGQKINMSCFAEEDPETGEIRPDVAQGWDWEKAKEMRAAHKDCGVILVASSDNILRWAMEQDWIDYIIPFHYSGLSKEYYNTLGWQDFQAIQTEQAIEGLQREITDTGAEKGRVRMHEITNPKKEDKVKGISDKVGTRRYLTLCKDRGLYPVFTSFCFKQEVFADIEEKYADKLKNAKDNEAKMNILSTIRSHCEKRAKAMWKDMVEKDKIDWSKINEKAFKFKKDYARTDTAFNVVNPAKINMQAAATPLQETIEAGLDEKYKEDPSITEKLVKLIDWSAANGNAPIGAKALQASRAKVDPMSYIMGGPEYPTAYKRPNRTEGVTLNQDVQEQPETSSNVSQGFVDYVNELFQRAWHGTPHRFDKFTLDHIGTGEGAQVHGWGLYFAQKREVSEGYRRKLLKDALSYIVNGKKLERSELENIFEPEDLEKIVDLAEEAMYDEGTTSGQTDVDIVSYMQNEVNDVDEHIAETVPNLKDRGWNEKKIDEYVARQLKVKEERQKLLDKVKSAGLSVSINKDEGQLFEVEIPDNDVLLDEQKRFSEQPEKVQRAIEKLLLDHPEINYKDSDGDDRLFFIKEMDEYSGRGIYDLIANRLSYTVKGDYKKAASLLLKEYGVLGITYEGGIDGRCFVVWDEDAIQIYNTLYQAMEASKASSPRGSYTRTVQGEDLIRIFQGHDASTVPHESAHAYHQLLEDMAADDGMAARQSCIDALVQTGMLRGVAEQYANIPVEEMGQVIAELQAQVVHFDESMNVEGADKEAISNDKKTILAHIDALTQLQRHHVAVEQARQDLKTIREWAGVPVEGTLTREQYIQVQEQFARGFEGYLATGKAPTTALAGVFARFKQWLLAIYKNIRDYVGADITPEIKDVYDRMLATEEEMQSDEVAQTMLGEMPDAIAMLGCNASDYAFLEDLLTRAHMAASSRVDKERAKDRRKRYKAAYDMALTSLMEQPLWRLATGGYGRINYESLQEYLNKKEANELRKRLPKVIVSGDGSSLDVIAMGFDDEMLSREFGGNADDIAQMLYEHIVLNGEKLQDEAKALANQALESQDAEYTVEDGLLAGDEYGDFLDALEDEAAKMQRRASAQGKKKAEARAAAAEQKAESAQAEAEARAKSKAEREAKLAGVRAERKALWAEYQRRAKEELDATPVGQIDPKRYAAMLRKALKGKDNAILSRDPDRAVEAVRKARYAYALMREAKRRRDMVERNLSRMTKMCRKAPGAIAPVPATALHRLMKLYGFREPKRWGPDPEFDQMSMQGLVEACVAENQGEATAEVTPDLAEWIMQGGLPDYAKDGSWQSLTWADYNDLMDCFNFFTHASKEQNQNSKDSMRARVNDLVESALAAMKDLATLENAPEGSWRRAVQNVGRKIFGAIQALQWQFRKADGFVNAGPKGKAGALESALMRPILEAEGKFKVAMKDLTKKLDEPLDTLRQTYVRLESEYGNKDGTLIKLKDADGNAVALPEALRQELGRSAWSVDQVLALALNCGNKGNRQRITGGYPDLNYSTLAAIVGSDLAAQICKDNEIEVPENAVYQSGIFTAEDWAAVQKVWDAIETLWEPTVAVHRSIYGFAPRRVDVEPMAFRAQGVEVALRGGYYPIYYDKDVSLDAQAWGERDAVLATTESFFAAPAARRGHTKSRQRKTKHPLRFSTSTLLDHVQDALKLIYFAEPVRFADKVTQDRRFAAEYIRCFGQEDYKALRPNLKGIVRSEPAPKDNLVKLANQCRKYLVSAGLWGNLKVAILQTTALGPAMGDLGAVPVWQAMGRIATGGWVYIKQIQAASPYMMSRWRAFDQDLLDKAQSLDINKRPKTYKIGPWELNWESVVNAGMTPLCLVDLVTSGAIWQAAYSKAMKEFGVKGAHSIQQESEFHEQAVAIADEAVKRSNPDFDASSRSAFLRAQNSYRLVNAFGSAVTLMAQRSEYMRQAKRSGRVSRFEFYRWQAYEYFAPAIAMTLVLALARGITGGGDDDGEKLLDLFTEALIDQYSMKLPVFGSILGDTAKAALGASTGGRQPTVRTTFDTVLGLPYTLATSAKRVVKDPSDDEAIKKLSYSIGDIVSFIIRVPLAKLTRNAGRGWDQWQRDEGTPLSVVMPAPGK